jgi:glutamate dehydrogenase (NAD(P)+)
LPVKGGIRFAPNVNQDEVEALAEYRKNNKGVKGYPKGTYVEDSFTLLEEECDIIIPATLEGVINQENAPRIKAKLIAEAVNGPVTFGADAILNQKAITIIPDAYLNAGGVTVSYFEWIKNLSHIRLGRMQCRYEKRQNSELIQAIEASGTAVSKNLRKSLL